MIWQPASARYASRIAEISSAGTRRASIFMGRLYRSWRVCPAAEGCAGTLDRGSVGSKPAPFWEAKRAAPGKATAKAKTNAKTKAPLFAKARRMGYRNSKGNGKDSESQQQEQRLPGFARRYRWGFFNSREMIRCGALQAGR